MIGLGEHEEPRKACIDFLSFASQLTPKAKLTSDFPLPSKGYTTFYFITKNSVLSVTAKENDLGNNRSPLSPLFHKAHEVVSEARIVDAATTGDEARLIELLDAKRNPNVSDSSGLTPLMAGAYSGYEKILKLLLDNNATIDQKDISGYTALMFACNAGKLNCAKLLIEHGANIHEEANDGSTSIMFCTQHGYNDLVLLLLSKEADPAHKGKHGLSAIGFAQQNNLVETEKILLENSK